MQHSINRIWGDTYRNTFPTSHPCTSVERWRIAHLSYSNGTQSEVEYNPIEYW